MKKLYFETLEDRRLLSANSIIVKFNDVESIQEIPNTYVSDSISSLPISKINFDGMTQEEALNLYRSSGLVEYAYANQEVNLQLVPNDPKFGELWGMTKIDAINAWDIKNESSNVIE